MWRGSHRSAPGDLLGALGRLGLRGPSGTPGARLRLVVVGGGMAAQHLVERLVDAGPCDAFELTLLCEETHVPYDRVHLGALLAGETSRRLVLREPAWYAAHGVALRLKQRVLAVDRAARLVRTDSGAGFEYDRLVLATGGEPVRPRIPGIDLPGVVTYRTLEDVERIAERARGGVRVVVAGGGLLGLEAARALQKGGCQVDVVEMAPRLLPRQLDVDGARLLEAQIRALGLGLRLLSRITEVREAEDELEVLLDDGAVLAAALVIVAAGIRPRDALARAARIVCHPAGGIVVDDALATSDPRVHAIGECARHRDQLYGFVAPCYAMAATLAARLLGEDRVFEGAAPSARLKIDELDVVAVGESQAEGAGVGALCWVGEREYRRVVLREGRVVGAIAVGPFPELPRLQEAVARGARVRAWQRRRFGRSGRLWREGAERAVAQWPDVAVLCTCTGVTCGSLRAARADGARSSHALSQRTGAGTVCGSCRPLLAELAGEQIASRRAGAGAHIGVAAGVALALVALALIFAVQGAPIPMSTSLSAGPSLDVLWRDAFWKQVSGFSLLGLAALALLFSLRKRWRRVAFGSFRGWRLLHASVGAGTLLALAVHTGFRAGANLNFLLLVCFSGVVATGALAGLVVSLEHRLPPRSAAALRRGWTAGHILAFWPLPVLTVFHVLAVYFF
jgi:nitrite reductase (NADH) large subunit